MSNETAISRQLNKHQLYKRMLALVFVFLCFPSLVMKSNALEVVIAVTVEGLERPTIVGATNLPDDSKLLVSLKRKQANYFAQAHATVVRGKFSAGPFSAKGAPVPPGDYEVEVVFPLASTQPPSVRRVVGESNEKLKGKLVDKGRIGITAKRVAQINIGGLASPERDKKHRAEDEIAMKKWRKESCEWIARVTKTSRSVDECVRDLERK